MMSQSGAGKKQDVVDCEINKSLDELVSQDMNLNKHKGGGAANNNSFQKGRDGSGSRHNRGASNGRGQARYNNNNNHNGSRDHHAAGSGNNNSDEREVRGGHSGRHSQERFNNHHHHRDRPQFNNNSNERGDRADRGGRFSHGRPNHNSNHSHHRDERERESNSGQGGVVEQRDAYGKNVEGRRVFVSNLAYETQWKYLKDHMRQAGDVVRADIFENKDGTSRGIGVVEFRTKQDAQRALSRLDGSQLEGRKLYLKLDTQGHVFPPLQSKKEFGFRPDYPPSYNNDNNRDNNRESNSGYRGRGGYDNNQYPSNRQGYQRDRRSRSRGRSDSPRDNKESSYNNRSSRATHQRESRRDSSDKNPERSDHQDSHKKLTIQKRQVKPRESSEEGGRTTFSVHISNLPYSVDRNQLRDAFTDFGKILHSSVSLNERGQSRGFGVIEYDTKEAAMEAAQSMDKASFNDREVVCKFYSN